MNSESGLGIDEMRKLKNFLSLRPYAGHWRVVLIDEAERLGAEAAAALLKIIEEPPASSLIFLITTNARALLPTIASRMMEIKFAPHARVELIDYLGKMNLNKKQAEFLTDFANGRLGLAYRLQQSDSFKDIRKNLEQLNYLAKANYFTRLDFAEKVFSSKTTTDPQALLLNWMFYLRSDFSKGLNVKRPALLRKMLEMNKILGKPQYNHRLAFENLLLWI
jgi:DNA polymerase-3 subunit delta'